MKLEAVDPLNLSSICVATIAEVLRDGYLMIDFDGSVVNNPAGVRSPMKYSHLFCYHVSSPYLFPAGFCEKNSLKLSVPKGVLMVLSYYVQASHLSLNPTILGGGNLCRKKSLKIIESTVRITEMTMKYSAETSLLGLFLRDLNSANPLYCRSTRTSS